MADLCDKVLNEAGEDNAAVFEIRQMMPEDEEYPDAALDDQPAILVADDPAYCGGRPPARLLGRHLW